MNPTFQLIWLFVCLSLCSIAQHETPAGTGPSSHSRKDIKGPENQKTFYLENTRQPEKKVKLPDHFVILFINERKDQPDVLSRTNTMECFFDTLVGDSLSVRIINEEIEIEKRHLYSNTTNNYYAGSFSASYRKINLAEVRYLSMKNPLRTNLSRIGTVLMSLSVLALVVTPFAGMGLEGDEKAQKREQVFVAGAVGVGISIPLFVFGRNKKYGMQPDFDSKGKNVWVLKQKH